MNRTKKTLLYSMTVLVIVFAFVWDYYIKQWLEFNPGREESVVRVDQFVLYPLIVTLVALSIFQLFRKKK